VGHRPVGHRDGTAYIDRHTHPGWLAGVRDGLLFFYGTQDFYLRALRADHRPEGKTARQRRAADDLQVAGGRKQYILISPAASVR